MIPLNNAKVLLVDIETSPLISYTWGVWETNVIQIKKDWHILSFVAKWHGTNKVISCSLPDFPRFKKDKDDDKDLVQELWNLFNEANVIIAHNGNSFDIKKANARFIANGLTPPSSYKTVDTKLVAKRYFAFDHNSLDELGRYLGLGRKVSTGGFSLWLECMAGDKSAWKKMMAYNKQDVLLLEKVYEKLRPWIENHPNIGLILDKPQCCPICGQAGRLQARGFSYTKVSRKRRYQCQDCFGWSTGKAEKTGITIR